jgi:hypothetical protein
VVRITDSQSVDRSSILLRDAMYTTELYFEAHITIDPVPEDKLDDLRQFVKKYGFRVADLYKVNGERSVVDSFMTARDTEFKELDIRTAACVAALTMLGYTVRRYKIENTLLDVRLAVQ